METKTHAISRMLLDAIAETGSVRAGYDKVMGEGSYDQLASELFDRMQDAK